MGELWLLDTDAQGVIVARRSALESPLFDEGAKLRGPEALRSPALPGFQVPVEELFRFP